MPCPPSPEEMEYMRLEREIDDLKDRLAKELVEINEINQVLKEVKACYKDDLPQEWKELYDVLTQRDVSKSVASYSPSSLDDEELKRYSEHVSSSYSILKYAEIHQCEQRTLLMNLWRMLPKHSWPNEKLKEEIEKQKKLHLQHRLEDRSQVIFNLRREQETNSKKAKTIQKEIERIIAIPEEDLLYDRMLF